MPFLALILSFLCLPLSADCFDESELMRDLMIVDCVNRKICDRMPVYYNHFLQGGYLNMPSARMGEEGELAAGYSSVSPYTNYNLRAQLFRNVELTGSYRVFRGLEDPVLSPFGFGDFSDKGANIKFAIIHPEDSEFTLPGIAIGFDDFLGTRQFKSKYIVLTQVIPSYNFECSFGIGAQRINRWFGGALWMPFRCWDSSCLRALGITAEYDAIRYSRDPHPDGREQKSPLNVGVKYRWADYFDFSLSYVRGMNFAAAASVYYNFGKTEGFLPKIEDPLPYTTPVNTQPMGELRPEEVVVQDMLYAFKEQGFMLLKAMLTYNPRCEERILRLFVYNGTWSFERDVRIRLNHLLAYLTPGDIDRVIVVMESEGFPIQEYHFRSPFLEGYETHCLGDCELDLLTPMTNVSCPDPCATQLLFQRERPLFCTELLPKCHTYFGSSTGKFKYALGVNFGAHGFLPGEVYYHLLLGYIGVSRLENLRGVDLLNPSQLINVHTDSVLYYKSRSLTLDVGYLQKTHHFGRGLFGRVSLGYYSQPYAGIATELLYYPANSHFACGIEAAVVRKRKTHGISFSPVIRKYVGDIPTYVKFTGTQCFFDLYYDNPSFELDAKISIGKFLANDTGIRYEVGRYFSNGLRVSMWYTWTNAHDRVNGSIYHDKGVAISMPLDIFYCHSCRDKWVYGMSAWLRDCGYRTNTGCRLYEQIHDQRIK